MHEKNFLAFFLVEHHVIREKGRVGKDQVVNLLRTDVPSSHYRTLQGNETMNMLRKGQIRGVEKRDSLKQATFIASLLGMAI